ncbi:molecular chaperone DnaJ [Novosphingobium umbonatum]|uniref:Molecular chaperone DnaJ n=1 Tax=Novosphingobium umbonatum TaxID=1908524 RepID=A0A3S2VCT2_9SPHN|nr:J domain-containing protein [Novosphingobium umbonatum]RVU04700.1 molecular chaperone DnaJ [Novosphingobium umbonatum]
MTKLLFLALVGVVACRWWTGQWPWVIWARLRGDDGAAKARNLLGVSRDAGRAEIIAAHKRLIVQVHPDKGGDVRLVHEANAARDLLLAGLAGELPKG